MRGRLGFRRKIRLRRYRRRNKYERYKVYNEYELRFLRVLVSRKMYENIEHLQVVQPMKSKRVYEYDGHILFERDKRDLERLAGERLGL